MTTRLLRLVTSRQRLRTVGQKRLTPSLTFTALGCLNPDGHEWSMATQSCARCRRIGGDHRN